MKHCPNCDHILSGGEVLRCQSCGWFTGEPVSRDEAANPFRSDRKYGHLAIPEGAPSTEVRFVKHYPCGCSAGPGPQDLPDYCRNHGFYEDTSGCITEQIPPVIQ